MKNVLGLIVGSVLLFAAAGCSNECDDLQSNCDSCANASYKANCQALVDADDGDACQLAIDLKVYEGVACN